MDIAQKEGLVFKEDGIEEEQAEGYRKKERRGCFYSCNHMPKDFLVSILKITVKKALGIFKGYKTSKPLTEQYFNIRISAYGNAGGVG